MASRSRTFPCLSWEPDRCSSAPPSAASHPAPSSAARREPQSRCGGRRSGSPDGRSKRPAELLSEGIGGAERRLRETHAQIRPDRLLRQRRRGGHRCQGVDDLAPGDRVACSGAGYANHAEALAVPRNLVARVPDDVSLEAAATVTLGAIALHGVRRAEPTLGETFVVVGLGAMGSSPPSSSARADAGSSSPTSTRARTKLAVSLGADGVIDALAADAAQAVRLRTGGIGADGVVITAASSSDEIVSGAFRMCRPKGRVVLVGDVGLHLRREDLYPNELELRISTSTGPGRYDPTYEEEGVDYPIGYVRWTENRNMQAILDLLAPSRSSRWSRCSPGPGTSMTPSRHSSSLSRDPKPVLVLLRGSGETSGDRRPELHTLASRARRPTGASASPWSAPDRSPGPCTCPTSSRDRRSSISQAVVSRHGTTAPRGAAAVRGPAGGDRRRRGAGRPRRSTRCSSPPATTCTPIWRCRRSEAGKHVLVEKPLADRRVARSGRPSRWFAAHAADRRSC